MRKGAAMKITKRRRPLATLCAALMTGTGLALAPGVAAAQPPSSTPASAPAKQCTTRDGFPPAGGTNIGGVPNRYKYGSTPYVGARFDGCANTLKLYYGGYSSPWDYYEVRYTYPGQLGWFTWRLTMGERRVSTVNGPAHGDWNFKVRACAYGIDEPGCTGWSPQLFLHAV